MATKKEAKSGLPEGAVTLPKVTNGDDTPEVKFEIVSGAGMIYALIPKIMKEVEPIAKGRKNKQGEGYMFRGIDDIYIALQAILAKYGVFTVPTILDERSEERQTRSGGTLIYRILKIQYRFYALDGSYFDAIVIGEAMDTGDKATNKAMSVAHKYVMLQVFCIPTSDPKDPENDSPGDEKTDGGIVPKGAQPPVGNQQPTKTPPANNPASTTPPPPAQVQLEKPYIGAPEQMKWLAETGFPAAGITARSDMKMLAEYMQKHSASLNMVKQSWTALQRDIEAEQNAQP